MKVPYVSVYCRLSLPFCRRSHRCDKVESVTPILLIISSHRFILSSIASFVRLEFSTVSHSFSAGGEGAGFCAGGRLTRRETASQRFQFHVCIVSRISSGVKATLKPSGRESLRGFFELDAVEGCSCLFRDFERERRQQCIVTAEGGADGSSSLP